MINYRPLQVWARNSTRNKTPEIPLPASGQVIYHQHSFGERCRSTALIKIRQRTRLLHFNLVVHSNIEHQVGRGRPSMAKSATKAKELMAIFKAISSTLNTKTSE